MSHGESRTRSNSFLYISAIFTLQTDLSHVSHVSHDFLSYIYMGLGGRPVVCGVWFVVLCTGYTVYWEMCCAVYWLLCALANVLYTAPCTVYLYYHTTASLARHNFKRT